MWFLNLIFHNYKDTIQYITCTGRIVQLRCLRCLTIADLVKTQCLNTHLWKIDDVVLEQTKNKLEAWKRRIKQRQPMFLPLKYNIGTAFVANPSETSATEYKEMCNYIRMELVLLIEHLHCANVEAVSMRDCQTKWWRYGKPQQDYVEKIEKDPLMPYIHRHCFSEYRSLRLSKIDDLI
jgi:hypothetical protein